MLIEQIRFIEVDDASYQLSFIYKGKNLQTDNTATTLVFPMTTYDAHATPTTTDQVFIGPHNCTTAITVTVDETTGVVITWADSGNFSQVATDLTSLTYA